MKNIKNRSSKENKKKLLRRINIKNQKEKLFKIIKKRKKLCKMINKMIEKRMIKKKELNIIDLSLEIWFLI
jgi:hypothetical protein